MTIEEYRRDAIEKLLADHVVCALQEHATDLNVLVVPCPKTSGPGFGGVYPDHLRTCFVDLQTVADVASFAIAVRVLADSVIEGVDWNSAAVVFVSYVTFDAQVQFIVHETVPGVVPEVVGEDSAIEQSSVGDEVEVELEAT